MTKEQWNKVVEEIVPHLEAIRQITMENRIDRISMCAGEGKYSTRAFYIEDDIHYNLSREDGKYYADCDFRSATEIAIEKPLAPGSNQGLKQYTTPIIKKIRRISQDE